MSLKSKNAYVLRAKALNRNFTSSMRVLREMFTRVAYISFHRISFTSPHDAKTDVLVYLITESNQKFKVTQSTLVIGRDESCDLRSKGKSISRKHCAIIQKKEKVYVKDLNSSNGTFVNGERLKKGSHVEVFDFDDLRIGKMVLKLSILDEMTELPHLRSFKDDTNLASQGSSGTVFETAEAIASGQRAVKEEEQEDEEGPKSRETVQLPESQVEKILAEESSSGELEANDATSEKEDEKAEGDEEKQDGPKGLPDHLKRKSVNSRDAAMDALSRHFRR